jgi:hypothetical protein
MAKDVSANDVWLPDGGTVPFVSSSDPAVD